MHAAVVACVFDLRLVAGEELARRAIGIGVLPLAAFADPAGELVGVEVRIAAVRDGSERPVFEREERGVRTLRRPRRIPRAGSRAHAPEAPAAEQPHDVDVMRRLVVDRAAAERRVELLRSARAVEEVGEVERGDHAQAAVRAALD